ncbi:MAG: hypothetical protein ACREHG_06850 [Candidatus Saccharimonadales bacterium]
MIWEPFASRSNAQPVKAIRYCGTFDQIKDLQELGLDIEFNGTATEMIHVHSSTKSFVCRVGDVFVKIGKLITVMDKQRFSQLYKKKFI